MSAENEFFWTDAYLLGYQPMDDTHREFVEVVNAMINAPDAEFAAHLDAFARHAETHFEQERAWMEKTGFPAKDCHNDEHDAVMKSVREVIKIVADGDVDEGRRLAAELRRWFPGHADYLDASLAQWLVKKSLGGAPIVVRRNVVVRDDA
jgi:hemerythrin